LTGRPTPGGRPRHLMERPGGPPRRPDLPPRRFLTVLAPPSGPARRGGSPILLPLSADAGLDGGGLDI